MAEKFHDLIIEPLAAAGPAARARQLFDTTPQSGEADDLWRLIELLTQFVAQPGKEGQLESLAGFAGQLTQVGVRDPPGRFSCSLFDRQSESAQHTGQRLGKLADGDKRLS